MEQETIIYYYPMPEQTTGIRNRYAARQHWFQEASLETVNIAEQAEFQVLGCAVPPFYYRHKPWKAQRLSAVMETALHDTAGMADTCVHPVIRAMLTDEYCPKWTPRESTVWMLVRHLLGEHAEKTVERCGTVTVLLGSPTEADRQMEVTWELLQPFLPRVNRMLIYYEEKEQEDYVEIPGLEEENGLKRYLEDYYYEYGLVPQLAPYVKSREAGEGAALAQQSGMPGTSRLRCGKEKCAGVILDHCGQFRYPKILPESGVYIDTVSVPEKERLLKRKGLPIPYLSPLKYLDTMVKNSYDRLVKKGAEVQ